MAVAPRPSASYNWKAIAGKPQERGEGSIYDGEGGEWRPHLPDKHHPVGHWDDKGPGKESPWENKF